MSFSDLFVINFLEILFQFWDAEFHMLVDLFLHVFQVYNNVVPLSE